MNETREENVAALLREREGYEKSGQHDKAAEVDERLHELASRSKFDPERETRPHAPVMETR